MEEVGPAELRSLPEVASYHRGCQPRLHSVQTPCAAPTVTLMAVFIDGESCALAPGTHTPVSAGAGDCASDWFDK